MLQYAKMGRKCIFAVMQNWNSLTAVNQLTEIETRSFKQPQILFKHSTRCSISDMALNRLKRDESILLAAADLYYLDLIRFREVSNEIASRYGVEHESPQALVIKDGKQVFHASHHMIIVDELLRALTN